MSDHGIKSPSTFRVLSVEEILALYPGAMISVNHGKPMTQQEGFERMRKNMDAMNRVQKEEKKYRLFRRIPGEE